MSQETSEEKRLDALRATELLDTPAEPRFDRVTRMAQAALGTKIALVSLIDADRQWFKSNVGLDAVETPRNLAFCDHAIRTPDDVMVVLDASKDDRFSENPLVKGNPSISFYAGAPLVTAEGHALGTLCVIDSEPRTEFSVEDQQILSDLAETVMNEINLVKVQNDNAELQAEKENLGAQNADLSLINEELQHRMGNMYAHISGLVTMLGRSDVSRDQLVRRIRSKISVLAHTQTLLARNSYSTVSLKELAETTLEPFGWRKADVLGRINVRSDQDFEVSARAAFTITLMLNELATNAMKHGALADDKGHVIFSWTLTPTPKLSWREMLSAPRTVPSLDTGEGFGMQILSKIVPMDFRGEVKFEASSTGLVYEVTADPGRLLDQ